MEFQASQVPVETRWAMAAKGLTGSLYVHLNALYEAVGKERYTQIVRQIWSKMGKDTADALRLQGMADVDARSIAEAGAMMCLCSMGPEYKMEIVEATRTKTVIKILQCPWKNRMTESGLPHDLLSACDSAFWKQFVKGLSSDVTMRHGKQMHRGDAYCEWIFEDKTNGL